MFDVSAFLFPMWISISDFILNNQNNCDCISFHFTTFFSISIQFFLSRIRIVEEAKAKKQKTILEFYVSRWLNNVHIAYEHPIHSLPHYKNQSKWHCYVWNVIKTVIWVIVIVKSAKVSISVVMAMPKLFCPLFALWSWFMDRRIDADRYIIKITATKKSLIVRLLP